MLAFIPVIVAILGYFTAKKSGAKTATAAAVGAAAGLGTYYVATQTDWGKSLFADANGSWVKAVDEKGTVITDAEGREVYVPAGEKAIVNGDGKPVVAADGTWFTKTLDTTASILKSWGGAGTAAVIGTATVASSSSLDKYLPWLLIGGVALLIMK